MSLLVSTIQEYLTENHHKWTAIAENRQLIGIHQHPHPHPKNRIPEIVIDTDKQTITYLSYTPSQTIFTSQTIVTTRLTSYNHHTLLPQITKAINQQKQP